MYKEYLPEYAAQLLDHMALGQSFESFAATLRVSGHTLISWCAVNVDFREAREIGQGLSLHYWESQMLSYINDPEANPRFNASLWKFNVSSQFPHLYGSKSAVYYQRLENEIYSTSYGVAEPSDFFAIPVAEPMIEFKEENSTEEQIETNPEPRLNQPTEQPAAIVEPEINQTPKPQPSQIVTTKEWNAEDAYLINLLQHGEDAAPRTEEEYQAMMKRLNGEVSSPRQKTGFGNRNRKKRRKSKG